MKILKRGIFLCTLLLLYNPYIFGQNMRVYPSIEGLKEFAVPSVSSSEWYRLNYSKDDYYVDDTGIVIIRNESGGSQYIYETDNGKLIGTNHGEWGGKLIFKNDTVEYTIIHENICGIVQYNNGIYVLTGLSHLRISEGKIIKIEIINGKWESTFFKEFDSSPEIYTIFENRLYIVTFDGLIIFDGDTIHQILREQFWSSLYPQSIYINEKIIAIGLWIKTIIK